MKSLIKIRSRKSEFSKHRHGGKLCDIIKIKMSVKWICYSFNEICVYLNQRKKKIKLADIWDHK